MRVMVYLRGDEVYRMSAWMMTEAMGDRSVLSRDEESEICISKKRKKWRRTEASRWWANARTWRSRRRVLVAVRTRRMEMRRLLMSEEWRSLFHYTEPMEWSWWECESRKQQLMALISSSCSVGSRQEQSSYCRVACSVGGRDAMKSERNLKALYCKFQSCETERARLLWKMERRVILR